MLAHRYPGRRPVPLPRHIAADQVQVRRGPRAQRPAADALARGDRRLLHALGGRPHAEHGLQLREAEGRGGLRRAHKERPPVPRGLAPQRRHDGHGGAVGVAPPGPARSGLRGLPLHRARQGRARPVRPDVRGPGEDAECGSLPDHAGGAAGPLQVPRDALQRLPGEHEEAAPERLPHLPDVPRADLQPLRHHADEPGAERAPWPHPGGAEPHDPYRGESLRRGQGHRQGGRGVVPGVTQHNVFSAGLSGPRARRDLNGNSVNNP
mmetsp:Transcript_33932/g.100785  ORF Transcript_33932/g.100785 Transcript_33932/m.100785 type:complete len:265 (+) Transcript_33932:3435-4229(+)